MRDNYAIGDTIGTGQYGEVYEVTGANGKKMAAKVGEIGPSECDFQKRAHDATMLAPDVYECGKNYILMELIEGETLDTWIEKVDDPRILIASLDGLADIYAKLSKASVAHMDMHSRNIIVTNDGWRVIDYGEADDGTIPWAHVTSAVRAVAMRIDELYPLAQDLDQSWEDSYARFLEYIKQLKGYFASRSQASESYKLANLLRGLIS